MEDFNFYTSKEQLNHYVLISIDSGFLLVFEPGTNYLDVSLQIIKNNGSVIQNELAYWSRHFNYPIIELIPILSNQDSKNGFVLQYTKLIQERNLPLVSFHAIQYLHLSGFKNAKYAWIGILSFLTSTIIWNILDNSYFLYLSCVILIPLIILYYRIVYNRINIPIIYKDIKLFESQTGIKVDDVNSNDRSIMERRYIKNNILV